MRKISERFIWWYETTCIFYSNFINRREILLLDEPFSALDALTKTSLQEWLFEQWQEWEKTILFITHDVEEALFLSNRVLVVEQTDNDFD